MNCKFLLFVIVGLLCNFNSYAQSFQSSGLGGESLNNPTSLQFGPDGRLYVSQQNGLILAYTVVRNGNNNYDVTNTETINLVANIQNHDDDGSINNSIDDRQVTGIFLTGTANTPVLYVTSSDSRIGGGGSAADKNLDTNSGMLSKLTKNGNNWSKVDLVRGLPRSEENHASNGIQIDFSTNTLYLAQGGHTNAGAPSNNFAFHTEYALSAAVLEIDLDALESMSVKTDASSGAQYVYDIPTVDDPTRPNVNGQDVGDPFGGNDGLNQAKLVPNGPVQVYSPGFRNIYDLVLTESGNLYTWDNGANGGWGGHPANEGGGNATNNWIQGEPGSSGPGPNDAQVNNDDGLHFISGKGYYGGHPCPIRANPSGAGLFTHDSNGGGTEGVWRTSVTGNQNTTLPSDWPPVPVSEANPIEGDFQNPGVDDNSLYTISASTNGMAEYTASNFGNALKGSLLAASFNENIYSINLNASGTINNNGDVSVLAANFGSNPLDVTAQGDNDPFPGTIWAVTYGSNNITVFEPTDYNNTGNPTTPTPPNNGDGIHINAGGPTVTTGGITWLSDTYFSGGKTYSGTGNIANTNSDAIYNTERYGSLNYTIPVANGEYEVQLHFAEIWSGAANGVQRVFDVSLEGNQVINDLNIFDEVGFKTATVRSFNVDVTDSNINIALNAVLQNPKISAISVIPTNVTVTPPTPERESIYINAGGPAQNIGGTTWSADNSFSGGKTYSQSGNIANTNSDAIYNTERYGNLNYTIPVANGEYEVQLHFAEIWSGAANGVQRVFDVSLEGDLVLNNFNIFQEVGFKTAVVKSFEIDVNDGNVNIALQAVVQNPKISAIAIIPSNGGVTSPPPVNCSGADNNNIDEDGDGYTNADEIDNGSNPCNAAVVPPDFDKSLINGFLVSNLNDPDDDDDGINDTQDYFAWDASNGQNTQLPIDYPLLNGDPGFGFFGLGFTGLMSNGTDDYLDLIEDEDNSATEIIAGGAVGLFTLNNVLDGDPYKNLNNQKNAFQFGVDVNQQTAAFAVETSVLGPIIAYPEKHESAGIYIGTGDQQNYLKVTVYAKSGFPSIQVLREQGGQIMYVNSTEIEGIGDASEVKLKLKINPANGMVQAQYAIGSGAFVNVADAVQLGGPLLQSVQNNQQGLAIGLISTSIGRDDTFGATWDYINVYFEDAPRLSGSFDNWVNVYPVPSRDYVNIDLSELMDIEIAYQVIDISGRVLLSGVFEKGHAPMEQLNISMFEAGMYHLNLKPTFLKHINKRILVMD